RERQVPRKGNVGAFDRKHNVGSEEERRCWRLSGIERLVVVEPVEHQLALCCQRRSPGVCEIHQEVVIEICKPGIEPGEWTECVRAGELIRAVDRVSSVDLGLVTDIPVYAEDSLICVLRYSAAYVGRPCEASFLESWQARRQGRKSAGTEVQCADNL